MIIVGEPDERELDDLPMDDAAPLISETDSPEMLMSRNKKVSFKPAKAFRPHKRIICSLHHRVAQGH